MSKMLNEISYVFSRKDKLKLLLLLLIICDRGFS